MRGLVKVVGNIAAAAIILAMPVMAGAQSPFAPVITVNGAAITVFEIDQRAKFLGVINQLGDTRAQAREALVEERLMLSAAQSAGLSVLPEVVEAEMEAFAARGNLTTEQFRTVLENAGVEFDSFREFARVRVIWRELVRSRFAGRVNVPEDEVDRAMAMAREGGGLRVLLSEIVLPVNEGQRDETVAFAEDLSRTLTSRDAFERAARRYSASPSRGDGGQIDWIDLSRLPANVAGIVVAMSPGEVTPPLELPQAVVLFQLRAMAEAAPVVARDAALDYMLVRLPRAGGGGQARLERIAAVTDTCTDLFANAGDLPENAVTRQSRAPGDIPATIRAELDRLDAGEISTRLGSSDGAEDWLVMLCGRSSEVNADASREDVVRRLRGQRIDMLASSFLAELRAAAVIEGQ